MFLTAQSIIFSIGHRRRMKPIENSRVCVKTATKLKKHPPKKVSIFGRIRVIGQGDETTKMNKPVGYLTKYPDGVAGDRGLYYNYILAANGLFIEAESPFITARVPVAYCEIRGLGKLEPRVSLTYGSIPHRFWDLALDTFLAEPHKERYVAVTAKAGYHFYVPVQDQKEAEVVYQVGESVVLELHSHAHMGAFFSLKDNTDEQGFKLFAVVGKLNTVAPVVRFRVGVYGYFMELEWKDVFDGSLTGAVECEDIREEVIPENDISDSPERCGRRVDPVCGRLWGHGFFDF